MTTSPSSFTKIKSDTQIWEKCVDNGFSPGRPQVQSQQKVMYPFISHLSSLISHLSSLISHLSSFIFHLSSLIVNESFTLRPSYKYHHHTQEYHLYALMSPQRYPKDTGESGLRQSKIYGGKRGGGEGAALPLTKVIPQNRISHTNVARHTLVEASVGKHSKGRREVLFAVQSFFLERVELWVRSDPEGFARHRFSEGPDGAVFLGRRVVDV